MANISVKDACEQLLAAAREYVELGGRIDKVIDLPFVALQIDGGPAVGAPNGVLPAKVSDDFMERLATFRRLASDLKKEHFQMATHDRSPDGEYSHRDRAESSI
jgi:hypothetical protein